MKFQRPDTPAETALRRALAQEEESLQRAHKAYDKAVKAMEEAAAACVKAGLAAVQNICDALERMKQE